MRLIALALVVMVPCASLAHGIGPVDDAPVVERTPSARLLPADSSAPVVTPEAPRPYYARWWFWTAMGVATATTIVAVAMGCLAVLFSRVTPQVSTTTTAAPPR